MRLYAANVLPSLICVLENLSKRVISLANVCEIGWICVFPVRYWKLWFVCSCGLLYDRLTNVLIDWLIDQLIYNNFGWLFYLLINSFFHWLIRFMNFWLMIGWLVVWSIDCIVWLTRVFINRLSEDISTSITKWRFIDSFDPLIMSVSGTRKVSCLVCKHLLHGN